MTRCILQKKNLPKTFWAEEARTTMFVQNKLYSTVMMDKKPYEAWYGHKPSMQLLGTFCCLCFSYVPHVKRDKHDKKAVLYIFIG